MKIGILIPTTTNNRKWNSYNDTYLHNIMLRSFLLSYDEEHEYIFYLGIDKGDKIMDNINTINQINSLKNAYKNIDFQFIYMTGIAKGHLTIMWNRLFKKALDDECDYFFQCGDDIKFKTKGWINDSIKILSENNNIGISGPNNNNYEIITQSFVSRKHFDLFGYYFPEELINWYCDDWINLVYKQINAFYPLKNHYCANNGGEPRYNIHNLVINNDNSFFNFYNNNLQINKKNEMFNLLKFLVKRDSSRIKDKILKIN